MKLYIILLILILLFYSCTTLNNVIEKDNIYKEKEFKNSRNLNDSFQLAENIKTNIKVVGYIGAEFDNDYYVININKDGILYLKIDISKSFHDKKLTNLSLSVYSDSWLQSNTSTCMTDPYLADGQIIDKDNIKYSNDSIEIKQSVTASHSKYFIRINATGFDGYFKGFDTDNPYNLTINFIPGKTLETDQPDKNTGIKDADIYEDANKIVFDKNTCIIKSYAYYWYDIDWYYFKADYNGWIRVTVDLTDHEDNNPGKTEINMFGSLFSFNNGYLNNEDFKLSVMDSPGCPYVYNEFTNIKKGGIYYLKFFCFEYSKIKPYNIKVEYYPGDPEDNQPGEVKASNDPKTSYDMGIIKINEKKEISSYNYHFFDNDYYKITTDNNNGELQILLDYKESYDKYGWYDIVSNKKNPYGLLIWLYVYKAEIYDKTKDSKLFLINSVKKFSPFQEISFFSLKNKTYYIMVNSRGNWDMQNPYKLIISYKEIKNDKILDRIVKK